ncbi:MAG: class I SAM-dependent methyltransferase [Candidatus Zixiibacteriota bacterium]
MRLSLFNAINCTGAILLNNIPRPILNRMRYLEEIDTRDRSDGTERMDRLRQIPPESGKFIALMAVSAPPGDILEIGTSAGYSTLWLALAARERKCKILTFETLKKKVTLAEQTFTDAAVTDVVSLIAEDALNQIEKYPGTAFCFLDAEKEVYAACYKEVIPVLASGGLLIADNVISHKKDLQPWVDSVLQDTRVDAIVVPIGKGLLLCRKR